METAAAGPASSRPRTPLIGVAILLFLGSAVCGCVSGYWFVCAQSEKHALEHQWQARRQPGNAEAEGVRTIVSLMAGIGPFGMDAAAMLKIQTMEHDAWKYLSFTLALSFAGYLILPRTRSGHRTAGQDSATKATTEAEDLAGKSPHAPARPRFRFRGRWLWLLIVVPAVLSALTVGWLYFNRPAPYCGVSLSGDLGKILSQEHYDLIRKGMTLDEVCHVLEMGEGNRECVRSCGEAMNSMTPRGAIRIHFDNADGSLFIAVKLRDGRVVGKKLHRETFNEPPLDLHEEW
jgi:hypothetical protein